MNPEPIVNFASVRRDKIRQRAVESLKNVFPIVGKKFTLDVKDVRVQEADVSLGAHKKAILQARSLVEPVRGTLQLRDNRTGKVVQELQNFNLLQLPYYTHDHTFLIDGTTYSVTNQLRMKPGVYTRKRKNEELEAGFNLERGANFRLSMDPEKGHFRIEYGSTQIPLYPVLNRLGVSDADISKAWNPALVQANRQAFQKNADKAVSKLYDQVIPEFAKEKEPNQVEAIRKAMDRTKMDPEINRRTLGKPFDKVSPEVLLAASGKLLRAYNQEEDFDERDSLAFKKLMTVDDFIGERINLEARELKRKASMRLAGASPNIERIIPNSPFTRTVHRFLATSKLSQNPDQINPLEMLDSSVRITSLGEGGIEDERAIPQEARRLHTSHFGAIDPIRTNEHSNVGIDIRATLNMAKDERGDIYIPLTDRKDNKVKYVRVADAVDATVAFPRQELSGKKKVDAIQQNSIRAVSADSVNFVLPNMLAAYSPAASVLPFVNSMDGNRALLASKHVTQALPLKDGEPPLIQVQSYVPGQSMEQLVARSIVPFAPIDGEVTKVKDGFIFVRPTARGKTSAAVEKIPYAENFPLAAKTYINHELRVKPGDKVMAGQPLADAAFAKNGQLTLGKNLLAAYIPWRGWNSNDAVVVSESGAKKLTSLHMYKEGLDVEHDTTVDRESHRTYFGNKYTNAAYQKLDDGGVVKPGSRVEKGDLLIAAQRKSALSPESAMLGKLHKSLVKPFRDAAVVWEHDSPGEVVDVVRSGNKIRLTVKTEEPLRIGDKISNRSAGKGVVSRIVPDDMMLKDENGNTIDIAITSAGVVSRVNPSQILETALAKVAAKTGKPIQVDNFADRSNVEWVKEQLKKHGLKDKETVFDPITGKKIPNILVGPQYVLKLFKSTETNYAARGVEDYDVNQQPSSGGITGAKGLGTMEVNALLAHNARNILRETSSIKSQKNDEFWRALQLGLPMPQPKTTFVYDKFGAMLTGSGVRPNKEGSFVRLAPLTDKEITQIASQAVQAPTFLRAKDLRPETGGFFDPAITGGIGGTKWSRIDLHEPVVNPVFEKPVMALLGMSGKELQQTIHSEGAKSIQKRLSKIDVNARYVELRKRADTARGADRDKIIKELKYLEGLRKSGLTPGEAYILNKIPVVPPAYRPVTPGVTGDLLVSDPNHLYRDLFLANQALVAAKNLPQEDYNNARVHLYDATKALFGLGDPVSAQARGRGVQGFLSAISGGGRTPKVGFVHARLLKKRQDVSGRGTIVPDVTLSMDEVGLPEDMAWSMYEPFVVSRMVQRGFSAIDARDRVREKNPVAREFLQQEVQERPVLLNRAPSLRRYNVLAAYPKLVPGKSIRIHELFAPIQGGDFDGDAMQVHVPVLPGAIEEAKNMTLSKMLIGDQYRQQTLVAPIQESIVGLFHATSLPAKGAKKTFKTKADALAAYHRGEIGLDTPVEIKNRA